MKKKRRSRHICETMWAREKYLVLSKSRRIYEEIRDYIKCDNPSPDILQGMIEQAKMCEEHRGRVVDAVQHIWGYFKRYVEPCEKAEYLSLLSSYRRRELEKDRILHFLKELSDKYPNPYIRRLSIFFSNSEDSAYVLKSGGVVNIVIKEYKTYNPDEMLCLYESVGWTNYTKYPERLERGFQNSLCVLAAYDGEQLLGIIRAVGDGFTILYIQDILVFPEFQSRGVGTRLMDAMLSRYRDVYQIVLTTDDTERTVKFYRSVGFESNRNVGCVGFMRINR